jgi:uncharacterized protein YggE
MKTSTLAVLIALSLFSLSAQTATRPHVVRANGQASVFATPDQVIIDTTVTTQGKTAQDASTQNAVKVAAVMQALTQLLGASADITTVSYSVGPVYQYPPNAPPVLTGYTATNTIEVKLGTINLAGAVIDAAVGAGATSVSGLRFALKDSDPSRQQALRLATLQARAHADVMATAVGMKVTTVVTVQEGAAPLQPIGIVGVAAPTMATTVQPGLIEVQSTVVLEAEIG